MGLPSTDRVLAGVDPLLPLGIAVAVVAGFALAPRIVEGITATRRPNPDFRDRLAARSGLPVPGRVRVVTGTRGRRIDAFAVGIVPGHEYVYVTEALVESFDEDELDAVLAHEAGHLELGHLRRRCSVAVLLGLAWGVPAAVGLGTAAATVGFGVTLFGAVLVQGIRHEYDADRLAARRAGHGATRRALERLKRSAPPSRVPAPLDRLSARAWLRRRIHRLRASPPH